MAGYDIECEGAYVSDHCLAVKVLEEATAMLHDHDV